MAVRLFSGFEFWDTRGGLEFCLARIMSMPSLASQISASVVKNINGDVLSLRDVVLFSPAGIRFKN